jgi:uncharacterized protein (DUF488 family)
MRKLYTIGYEGSSLDAFIETLRLVGVDVLYDIRERPLSRKPGFSKNGLKQALEQVGIRYVHDRRLGAPPEARSIAKAGKPWVEYFEVFDRYLNSQVEAIDDLIGTSGNVVLMCMERDVMNCHRKSVAREVSRRTGNKATHLGVQLA